MVPQRTLIFSFAIASLTATAALAQDVNYTSVEATSDKPVELSYHASAHKNCTPAPLADNSRHRSAQVGHADSAKSGAQD